MRSRHGATRWSVLLFAAFAAGVTFVSLEYLIPMIRAAQHADSMTRKHIGALSALVLAILLVFLLCA